MTNNLTEWFERMPVVAIIRGVTPDEVVAVGEALYSAGIGVIEVPLNSPDPFESIERLSKALGDRCVCGAGTVVSVEAAEAVAKAGGKIAVTPNTNPDVIKRCIELGMEPMPGWATLTDAFAAYAAGARYLKLFPAATYGAGHVKAASAVIPKDAHLLAVGGVGASNAAEWFDVGIAGLGIGSELYAPGDSPKKVFARAVAVVSAINAVRSS